MHLKLFGKTFFVIFSFALLVLLAFGSVIYVFGSRYQEQVAQMNGEVVAYAEADAARVVLNLAKTRICAIADGVAALAEEQLIKQQSTMSVLSADSVFASTTAKIIFEHGATGILEPKAKLIVSHPNASYVGKDLSVLPEFESPVLAPLWNLIDESVILDKVSGSYQRPYAQDSLRTRVICLVRVPVLTADNVRLVAFAAADRDDLGIAEDMLNVSLRQKYGEASAMAQNAKNDLRDFLIITFVVLLGIAFLIAWTFAKNISRSLFALINVCEHIGFGHLDTAVPIRGTGDEIDQLAASIARMQNSLSEQHETILRQSKSAELQTR